MAFTEVQASPFMKWEKVGDVVQGYLLNKKQQESQIDGAMQWIYELELTKALKIGDVALEAGDGVRVGGRRSIDMGLDKVEMGYEVQIKYTEDIKSKKVGNNPFKLIKVYVDKDSKKESFEETSDVDAIPF